MLPVFLLGCAFGALSIILVEVLGLIFVIRRLSRRKPESQVCRDVDSQQSLPFAYNKKGIVWILESDKIPREQKRKKEILEATPLRKYAKIKDRSLILTESDGSHVLVPLIGCTIAAVSATSFPSRKWAKKFPIKVESKTSVIYNGSKHFYIYLDTSWEKESWCKALRLASFEDKKRVDWFFKLSEEFQSYLTSLNAGNPSFMKPFVGLYTVPADRENRMDSSSSKVRLFLKKLAKKASKVGIENKASLNLSSGHEVRKIGERSRSFHDSTTGLLKTASTERNSVEENMVLPSSLTFPRSGSQSHISVLSDIEIEDKFGFDDGTLCWNLLISRLFFDTKSSEGIRSSLQARIQKTLSNMRIPNYIGDITCMGVSPGSVPPYIHGMRVLPMDMNEVWALEVDIEYSGGAMLDIETRLEVRELDFQKSIVDSNFESSSVGEVTSDLLEDFEHFREQLKPSEGTADALEQKDEGDSKSDGVKSSKGTMLASTNVSRWKSLLNSIAKQVSQVPLSLTIKLASFRGIMRLQIKPPPSDQIWFGFASMPDIDFELESSVGDRKIASGHVAQFLVNRFKAAIRDTLVLPNCESLCIPWMLAEKDDWIPRNIAPFMWVNHESVSDPRSTTEVSCSQPSEAKAMNEDSRGTSSTVPEVKPARPKNSSCMQPVNEASDASDSPLSSANIITSNQELKTPLLRSDESKGACLQGREHQQHSLSSWSDNLTEEQNLAIEDDDTKPKRIGRKARMFDLGKKMGEKLEEKRRHIEERGRHIVEKMRGP